MALLRQLFTFLLALTAVSAFAPSPRMATRLITTPLAMFSGDTENNGLETVDTTEESSMEVVQDATKEENPKKSVYKNLSTGKEVEVPWFDPAMAANTNPLEMEWWAYPLIVLPFALLLDDAFHFLPQEGPLAFLQRL